MPDNERPTQAEIEAHLVPLVGLKLSMIRLAPIKGFHFGELSPFGVDTLVGQYELDFVGGSWRIESQTEVITGRSDMFEWKYGRRPSNWSFIKGGSLQDAELEKLLKGYDPKVKAMINLTNQLIVERVEASAFGDAYIYLSGGYRLVIFSDSRFLVIWNIIRGDEIEPDFTVWPSTEDYGYGPPVTAADFVERAELLARVGGQDDEAISHYTEALRIDPQNVKAYVGRAKVFDKEKGNIESALADYTEALRLDPRNAEAYKERAFLYWMHKDDYDAAIADYSAAIQLDPADAYGHYGMRGFVHYLKDENQAALDDLNQSIQLKPTVRGYLDRSKVLNALGRPEEAIEDCNRALQLKPRSTSAYELRGDVKADMGDSEGAIEDYTRGLEFNPRDASSLNSRAWTCFLRGEYEKALADANAAIENDANSWSYFHTRGAIYAATNQVIRAICDFQKALDLKPDVPEYRQEMLDYLARWVRTPDEVS